MNIRNKKTKKDITLNQLGDILFNNEHDGNNYVLCKDVAYGSEDMYVLCGNSSPQFVDPEEFMIVFFTHTLKD